MFDLDASLEKQLLENTTLKQTLVFPEPEDPRVLNAVSRLLQFANIILVGKEKEVVALVDYGATKLECSRERFFNRVMIVDPVDHESLIDELAIELEKVSKGRKWELDRVGARERVKTPVFFAVMLVKCGYADAVLGGVTHSSRDFLMPCLRILEGEGTAFEMGLFALPDEEDGPLFEKNLVMFADVALNVQPNAKQLADIAVGACKTMRDIIPQEVLPEIHGALISYSTRGSGVGPSVDRIREAEPLIRQTLEEAAQKNPTYGSIGIVTEMQISVAVSPSAAKTKLKAEFEQFKGAGKANVLIVPSLDEGNMLYHLYSTRYRDSQNSLIMGGMRHQALDYSRGSTPEQIARGAKILLLGRLRSTYYRPTPKDYFFPRHKILAINPGSTSTRVALYSAEELLLKEEVEHDYSELMKYPSCLAQLKFRAEIVDRLLKKSGVDLSGVRAVVSRAGLLPRARAGVYQVDQALLRELEANAQGDHAANLGPALACHAAEKLFAPAYVADAPTIDERDELSKICGVRKAKTQTVWHALSHKAAGRNYADQRNKDYVDLNLIVAHLGGGISIGAHKKGRCVQVNNALFEGPMAPGRSGSLPTSVLMDICYSGAARPEVEAVLSRGGGLASHLGTTDFRKALEMVEKGDRSAALVIEAMSEQIAQAIAALTPKFKDDPVDQIILTGGLCRSESLMGNIKRRLVCLGIGVTVYPGGHEMEALRDAGLRILAGREEARLYKPTA